jgi:hypothetical protein
MYICYDLFFFAPLDTQTSQILSVIWFPVIFAPVFYFLWPSWVFARFPMLFHFLSLCFCSTITSLWNVIFLLHYYFNDALLSFCNNSVSLTYSQTKPALTSAPPPLTPWHPDSDFLWPPFGQLLWFYVALVNKLVLCALLSTGALEVWRLRLRLLLRTAEIMFYCFCALCACFCSRTRSICLTLFHFLN